MYCRKCGKEEVKTKDSRWKSYVCPDCYEGIKIGSLLYKNCPYCNEYLTYSLDGHSCPYCKVKLPLSECNCLKCHKKMIYKNELKYRLDNRGDSMHISYIFYCNNCGEYYFTLNKKVYKGNPWWENKSIDE
jgi:hypothetical protein